MAPISFRNSKIAYYGPHSCENCGVMIAKMGREWGGTAFTYPQGPIYPNTEWHPHVCDPALVEKQLGSAAEQRVMVDWPNANAYKVGQMGWVILGERLHSDVQGGKYLVISTNHTFYDTPESAWQGVNYREDNRFPTWHIDLSKYGVESKFADDLERLPQCPE